jgi:hypothetical protein
MPRLATRKINSSLKSSGSLVVAIASNASINVLGDASTTQYSWGCRAKLTSDNAAATVFFSKASAKYALQLRIETGGKIRASVYDGVNNPVAQSANTYTDNEWHTFIGVRDGTSLKLYIDGSLAGSTTSTINDCDESSGISMFGNGTKGVFSEGFVTLTAMTATEVMNHEINNTLPVSCLAILPCNEGAGSIAYDTSGNGNNATITSPTWTRSSFTKSRKAVGANLIYNGDFEIAPVVNVPQTSGYKWYDGTAAGTAATGHPNSVDDKTSGVYFWDRLLAGNSLLLDSTVKYSGNYSLKLSNAVTANYMIASLADFNRDDYIPVLPSTSYTYSYWMKTNYISGDSGGGAFIDFRLYNGARVQTDSTNGTKIKTTTDWTFYTNTFTTNATTRSLVILPTISGNTGTGTLIMDAWFDEITFNKTTPQTRTANTFPQRKTPDNLLSNGNFEYAPPFTAAQTTTGTWINGTATGSSATSSQYDWAIPTGGISTVGNVQYDTTVSYSGNNSIKLTSLDSVCLVVAGKYTSLVTAKSLPCLPSTSYTFSATVKTTGGGYLGAYLRIRDLTGSGSSITTNSSSSLLGVNEWTRLSITFTTAATARFLAPILVFDPNVAASAWFDDITLTKTYPVKSTRSLVDNTVIYNGNFEYVPTGTTATTSGSAWIDGTATGATNKGEFGWVIFNYTGSWAAKFDTTEKYSGTASMKISTTAVSSTVGVSNQEGSAASSQINNMPIAPSTSYTLSFKMKTLVNSGSATTGAYLSVIGYKVDGFSGASGFTGTTSSTAVNTTTDWTEYSITFTTASTAYYLRPELRITGNNGTGTLIMDAWFDDITLVKN